MTSTLTGYRVDIARSSAEFAVRNLAVHTVRGRIPIREAVVETDAGGRPVAVRALLDLTGIETGNHRRDRDLAQPRLLDTRRWPTLGFSGPVQVTGAGTWRVPGTLTAHGTATDVVLDVEATEDGDEVRARATTAFDRRALGIRAPRLLIGHEINVSVTAVVTLCPDRPRWPKPVPSTSTPRARPPGARGRTADRRGHDPPLGECRQAGPPPDRPAVPSGREGVDVESLPAAHDPPLVDRAGRCSAGPVVLDEPGGR